MKKEAYLLRRREGMGGGSKFDCAIEEEGEGEDPMLFHTIAGTVGD